MRVREIRKQVGKANPSQVLKRVFALNQFLKSIRPLNPREKNIKPIRRTVGSSR